jgi:Zn-dependent protease with chaperone function
MISIFLHLLLLGYGTVHFRGYLAVVPFLAMTVWAMLTIVLMFRTIPDIVSSYQRQNRVPSFLTFQEIWQWSLVAWILALQCFADPLALLVPDWLEKAPQLLPMLLSTFLYIFLARPLLYEVYRLFMPILDEEQTPADFFRARMTMPILFFPPLLFWTAIEDLASFGSAVDELQDIRLLIAAPVFFVFLYLLAPRLFNWAWRAEPMADEELRGQIMQLCERAETPISGVKIWDTFKEPVPNAAVAGLSQRYRFVYITSYLLELFSRSQVLSVVAHELAHLRLGHVFSYMVYSLDLVLASIAVKLGLLIYAPAWVGGSAAQDAVEMLMFLAFFALTFTALARECEYQADAFSASLTGSESFAGGLETLQRNVLPPPKSIPAWLLTHPEIQDRIDRVRSWCGNINELVARSRKIRVKLILVGCLCIIAAFPVIKPVWQIARLAETVQAENLAQADAVLGSLPDWLVDHPLVVREVGKLAMIKGRWDMAILQAARAAWNLNFRYDLEELHHATAPEVTLYFKFMQFMLQTLDLG